MTDTTKNSKARLLRNRSKEAWSAELFTVGITQGWRCRKWGAKFNAHSMHRERCARLDTDAAAAPHVGKSLKRVWLNKTLD
jgi:hypothetical protein